MVLIIFLFTVKPAKIGIEGFGEGSVVEVMNGKPLTLECVINDARPAPTITWYRDNMIISQGEIIKISMSFLYFLTLYFPKVDFVCLLISVNKLDLFISFESNMSKVGYLYKLFF